MRNLTRLETWWIDRAIRSGAVNPSERVPWHACYGITRLLDIIDALCLLSEAIADGRDHERSYEYGPQIRFPLGSEVIRLACPPLDRWLWRRRAQRRVE